MEEIMEGRNVKKKKLIKRRQRKKSIKFDTYKTITNK